MKINELLEEKAADNDELVIAKSGNGPSKTFWNGIAWMGTKSEAQPIKKSEVAALERKYRIRAKVFPAPKK